MIMESFIWLRVLSDKRSEAYYGLWSRCDVKSFRSVLMKVGFFSKYEEYILRIIGYWFIEKTFFRKLNNDMFFSEKYPFQIDVRQVRTKIRDEKKSQNKTVAFGFIHIVPDDLCKVRMS